MEIQLLGTAREIAVLTINLLMVDSSRRNYAAKLLPIETAKGSFASDFLAYSYGSFVALHAPVSLIMKDIDRIPIRR